jgi:hypothetical protein
MRAKAVIPQNTMLALTRKETETGKSCWIQAYLSIVCWV